MRLVNLGEFRDALIRVRSLTNVMVAPDVAFRPRLLAATLLLGVFQADKKLAGWSPGCGQPSFRPRPAIRPLMTQAIRGLFGLPLVEVLRAPSTVFSEADGFLDVTARWPQTTGERAAECMVVTSSGRWIPIDHQAWWWGNGTGPIADAVEYNPANLLGSQQGILCYFELGNLDRANAISTLQVARNSCAHFTGKAGDGKCALVSSGCASSGKETLWPRIVIFNGDGWTLAPEAFETLRQESGVIALGDLRDDLSLLAGSCYALRSGASFRDGALAVDESWLGRHISRPAWQALRP